MSGQDRDPVTDRDPVGDELHQRLCAWLFGELDADEARAFEAELARSPALQAERARLEATIGLVRQGAGAEALSAEAHESVLAAAGARPSEAPRARPRWSLLRGGLAGWSLAAMVLLALGTFVLVRSRGDEAGTRPFAYEIFGGPHGGEQVARHEEAPALSKDGAAGPYSVREKEAQGAEERAAQRPDEQALADATRKSVAQSSDERIDRQAVEELHALGYVDSAEPEAARAAAKTAADSGSFRGPGDTVPPEGGRTAPSAIARGASQPVPTDTPRREMPSEGLESLRALGYDGGGSAGNAAPPAPSEEVIGIGGTAAGKFGPRKVAPSAPGSAFLPAGAPGVEPARSDPSAGAPLETLDRLDHAGQPPITGSEGWFLGQGQRAPERRPWSDQELDDACRRLLDGCRPRPRETPGAMFFRCWGDNPFEYAALDPLSTFSVDVDTASYTLARRYLDDGYLPTKAQVRTEEFVNAFDADVPPPERGETFAVALELAPSLFGGDPDAWMLRVALRGEDVDRTERRPLALTFVVDVSGSMKGERIGLVKQAIALCVRELSTTDSVALVAFENQARIVSPMVSAASRAALESALVGLTTGGGTNVAAGLELGYQLASAARTPGAVNRVLLLSDGVGNIGETDAQALLARVQGYRAQGIYLNAVGVGMGNHDDAFLEQLADKGDGLCQYVDRLDEARRVFVDELTQTLQPIARDVKIQVAFDPEQVERYRLLGYENRAVADADFRNDAVDAGEVNAGHRVVALYELVRRPSASEAPLAEVRVRWKPPFPLDAGRDDAEARAAAERATERSVALRAEGIVPQWASASYGYRLGALVAQFAELLRRSVHARGDSWDELTARLDALAAERPADAVAELRRLVRAARGPLERERAQQDDELRRRLDDLCHLHYEEACRERIGGSREDDELSRRSDELRRELEERIRELLRRRVQEGR